MRGDFDEDEFEDYELRPGLDYGDTVVDAERTLDLDEASPLEHGLYNLCREVEQLPASVFQTRLSLALSTAMIEFGGSGSGLIVWPRMRASGCGRCPTR